MNLYFLVEGKTEKYIYPKIMDYLLPDFKRVKHQTDAVKNNYFIFSAMGFPNIHNDFEVVISDKEILDKYDMIIVVLDSDGESIEERQNVFFEKADALGLSSNKIHVIVQDICIETWMLGNKRMCTRAPQDNNLVSCFHHFNIIDENPEDMRSPHDYKGSPADYHEYYLKLIFREKSLSYVKGKNAAKNFNEGYFNQLVNRAVQSNHLLSFNSLLEVLGGVKQLEA